MLNLPSRLWSVAWPSFNVLSKLSKASLSILNWWKTALYTSKILTYV